MSTINQSNGNTLLEGGALAPVSAATTGANITLAGIQVIDTVTVGASNDRVLVKDQTDLTQNGIYAAQSGNWVRTSDAAGNSQLFAGMLVPVGPQGPANGGQVFECTCLDNPIVIGTSLVAFQTLSAVQAAPVSATSSTLVNVTATLPSITTPPTAGQLPVGQPSGVYVPETVSGDATMTAGGALTVTRTNGVAFAASATTDTSTQANVAFTGLGAAAAAADTDTLPVNQGAGNLKQTFAAIKAWIKGWAPVTNIASYTAGALTAWAPTVTPGSGTITTLGAVNGYYKIIDKLMYVNVSVSITTAGTAAGNMTVSMPTGTALHATALGGMEIAITGKAVVGYIPAAGSSFVLHFYDASSLFASGNQVVFSGWLELT